MIFRRNWAAGRRLQVPREKLGPFCKVWTSWFVSLQKADARFNPISTRFLKAPTQSRLFVIFCRTPADRLTAWPIHWLQFVNSQSDPWILDRGCLRHWPMSNDRSASRANLRWISCPTSLFVWRNPAKSAALYGFSKRLSIEYIRGMAPSSGTASLHYLLLSPTTQLNWTLFRNRQKLYKPLYLH